MHLALVGAGLGGWIITIRSPRRMIEVDYKIAVVRNNRLVESESSNSSPVTEGAPLGQARPVPRAFIGHLDVENEFSPRRWIAFIKNVRHDFVAEIQIFTIDSRLLRRNRQPHEVRTARGLVLRLAQFRNLVQLSLTRLAD